MSEKIARLITKTDDIATAVDVKLMVGDVVVPMISEIRFGSIDSDGTLRAGDFVQITVSMMVQLG